MNDLQTFLQRGNTQSRPTNQEAAIFAGTTIYGTFGDAQTMGIMTSVGYQDHLILPFKVTADQFASKPQPRQGLSRPLISAEYFVQLIDDKNPVVYTFILVDREL